MQRRETASDVADIALEVLDIDGVEADNSGVETYVGLCDGGAEVVRGAVGGKVGLGAGEGVEEWVDGFLVGLLSPRGGVLMLIG